MSFGKRVKNATKGFVQGGYTGAVFGALSPTGKSGSGQSVPIYRPRYTSYEKDGLGTADKGALDSIKALYEGVQPGSSYMQALNELPADLNVDSYYNNPFRASTRQLLSNPINQQFNLDHQQLTSDLNASNQLGGSYAAMQLNQLQQNYNQNLQNADLQAIKASADAYRDMLNQKQDRVRLFQQHYDSLLNRLTGFQQYSSRVKNGSTRQ
jgi:hypothetical protein